MEKLNLNMRRARRVLSNRYLILTIRLILGGIFLWAAVIKLLEPAQFAAIVERYQVLPHPLAQAYGLLLPWMELALGIFLVMGVYLRPSIVTGILVLLSFIIAKAVVLYQGTDFDCGCFGESLTMLSSQSMVLDILLLGMALLLLFSSFKKYRGKSRQNPGLYCKSAFNWK